MTFNSTPSVSTSPVRPFIQADELIRLQIVAKLETTDWIPFGLNVSVRCGVVQVSGVVASTRARIAALVAIEDIPGVEAVHDRLSWAELFSTDVHATLDEKRTSADVTPDI